MDSGFETKILICADCQEEFVFTIGKIKEHLTLIIRLAAHAKVLPGGAKEIDRDIE